MKTLRLVLVTVAVMTSFIATNAQKTDLTLNLKKGDVFTAKMVMNNNIDQMLQGQPMKMQQDMQVQFIMTVTDILSNGNYLVNQSFTSLAMNLDTNGQKMVIDSEDTDNPASKSFQVLKDMLISFEVSPSGEVTNIKGYEDLAEKLGNPQMAGMLKGITGSEQVSGFFDYIPKTTIKKGDSYTSTKQMPELMDMDVTTKYTVSDITKDAVSLDVSSHIKMDAGEMFQQNGMDMKMKANGDQTGMYNIDIKSGMLSQSDITMDMDMEISFKNPQNEEEMTMPMVMKAHIVTTVAK